MELNLSVKTQEETKQVKKYTAQIYGAIKNQKEQDLVEKVNGKSVTIGKYWVCARVVHYGIRGEKQYNSIKEAQDQLMKLYNMGIVGDFVIVQDNESQKYYIKTN